MDEPIYEASLGTTQDSSSAPTCLPQIYVEMDRPRRAKAGSNMGRLIEQEETADEFYQTAYGGFEEASGDEEYEVMVLIRAHHATPTLIRPTCPLPDGGRGR